MGDQEQQLTVGQTNIRRSERLLAYSYVRVSSPQQDLRGELEGQISRLADYAKACQIIAHKYYADRAVSLWQDDIQTADEQVALQQLQSDILKETNPLRFIFGTSVSRFARNRHKGDEFFQWAMKHNIILRTLRNEYLPDDIGRSAWYDQCVLAEEYDQQLSANAREAHANSETSGRPKWGFENRDGQRAIKPSHADVVRSLYKLASGGASIEALAQFLDESGSWNPVNRTQRGTVKKVRSILHDPEWAGMVVASERNRRVVLRPATWEGCVDYQQFLQLQLTMPSRVILWRDEFYLLGKVNCADCRKPLRPAYTDYRWISAEQQKFVHKAYVCPENGCNPAMVYDAERLHLAAKRLLETWEQVSGDKGFYLRWMNAFRRVQIIMVKSAFRTKHFYVSPKQIEVRFEGETYAFPI